MILAWSVVLSLGCYVVFSTATVFTQKCCVADWEMVVANFGIC